MNRSSILKKIIGPERVEILEKALVKLNTKSVVDLEELHSAIKTVPKSLMAFLVKNTKDMEIGGAKEIELPFAENSRLLLNKLDNDVYNGHIVKDSKIIQEFSLTAIPQLAAHIMSAFELYDHDEEAEIAENMDSGVEERIKKLEQKINALIMMVAGVTPEEIQKSEKKLFMSKLKKAGSMPKMPSPPGAGTKVGGSNGITKAGIRGNKTAASDTSTRQSHMKNPDLKAPKMDKPKEPTLKSEITFKKSQFKAACTDCGQQAGNCACFQALSKPILKKNTKEHITLAFGSDWDHNAVMALYKSIARK